VTEVVVTAPARLHFGMLDPAGLGRRRFGGVGVGIESPRVVVSVAWAGSESPDAVVVSGAQAERAMTFGCRSWSSFELGRNVEVRVHEAIPPHVGLGSGTKLGLAIARALAALGGIAASPERLAEASGRGARSSVGLWTFASPGLVIEAGVVDDGSVSPMVARHLMPERWRCVLALPRGGEGLSGDAEERFFGRLYDSGRSEPSVSRLVLTALLPGLLAGDIEEFGVALTQIQREVGAIFAAQQGGVFHPRAAPLVDALHHLGVTAVGQSSWGPSVYGIVDGPELAVEVAERLRGAAGAGTEVSVVDFDRRGGWVGRGVPGGEPA
jgi:beta-ribofuranosylaminobenzene 5'-phosphate synthase